MYSLSIDEAIKLVRRNIDEQSYNDSDMEAVDDNDSTAFEDLCKKLLPEAINDIHLSAPVELLDGIQADKDSNEFSFVSIPNNVLTFGLKHKFLRLVAFKAADSSVLLSKIVNEISTEGRMQLNAYTRGTYDNPCLVLKQGKKVVPLIDTESEFEYYSLSKDYPEPTDAIERLEYIPMYSYGIETEQDNYDVAESLVDNVINQLTAKVLMVYDQADKAKYFFTIAGFGNNEQEEK